MKKVKTILETGVTTYHNQEGRIEVKNSKDYDPTFDLPTMESELQNYYMEQFTNISKVY